MGKAPYSPTVVQIDQAEIPKPLNRAGLHSRMYSCEYVVNRPLANPMINLAAYRTPMLVVTCIITVATMEATQAIQSDILRPYSIAPKPAVHEVTKAPSVISDEMSCCRSDEMLYPIGLVGSSLPNTYILPPVSDEIPASAWLCVHLP